MTQPRPGAASELERTISALTAASTGLAEAQARLASASQAVQGAGAEVLEQLRALRSATEAAHDPMLISAVRHLYWHHESLSSRDIAEAAGFGGGTGNRGVHGMVAAIGPVPSGIECANCGAELMRTSRSWGPGSPPLCQACRSDRDEERNLKSRLRWMRALFVGSSQVTATVLEWRAVTTLILAYPPASHGVTRGSEDDHQLGIWRRWEQANSLHEALIQMAAGDHEVFGVPARVTRDLVTAGFHSAGWDAVRTRAILDPLTEEPAHSLLTRIKRGLDAVVTDAQREAERRYIDGSEPAPEAPWPWDRDSLGWW